MNFDSNIIFVLEFCKKPENGILPLIEKNLLFIDIIFLTNENSVRKFNTNLFGGSMKSLKDSFLIKTSYTYINLIYRLYPIVIILLILQSVVPLTILSSGGKIRIVSLDFFNLFSFEKSNSAYAQSFISIVIISLVNITVAVLVYLGIRKLFLFIKNVFKEKPFISENGNHLKFVGLVLMSLSIINQFSKLYSFYFGDFPTLMGVVEKNLMLLAGALSVFFSPLLIIGVFVYAFGEIIIRAAGIKEEIDLTV